MQHHVEREAKREKKRFETNKLLESAAGDMSRDIYSFTNKRFNSNRDKITKIGVQLNTELTIIESG